MICRMGVRDKGAAHEAISVLRTLAPQWEFSMAFRRPTSRARQPIETPRESRDAPGAGVQVFDAGQVAEPARGGIHTTHAERLPMSLFESLRHGAPRQSGALRLLAAAWAIFFAASVFSSGCLVTPAAAGTTEPAAGAPAATAHKGSTRDADCCDAMRAGSADTDSWGVASADRMGATPPGLLRRATYLPPVGDPAAGAAIPTRPAPPVPTYLLTLRLRA